MRLPPQLARAGLVVGLLAIAFTFGRGCKPEPRVEVREVERVVERVVEKRVEVKVRDTAQAERRNVTSTKITKPDGTKIETVVDLTGIDTLEREAEVRVEVREVERLVYRDRVQVSEPARPSWRASILAGTDVSRVSVSRRAPFLQPLQIGGHLERRVVGPIWLGVWGLSGGSVGVSLGAEWQ